MLQIRLVSAGATVPTHQVPWCRGGRLQREKTVIQVSGMELGMPGASQGIFYFLITPGRAIGLSTSNLGESWSVVMMLIIQVVDRLARTTALLVTEDKKWRCDSWRQFWQWWLWYYRVLTSERSKGDKSRIAALDFGLFGVLARFRGRLSCSTKRHKRVSWYLLKVQE